MKRYGELNGVEIRVDGKPVYQPAPPQGPDDGGPRGNVDFSLRNQRNSDYTEREDETEEYGKIGFTHNRDEFINIQKRAVDNMGIVKPGIASEVVNVIDAKKHSFDGMKPSEWAEKNLVTEHVEGKEIVYDENLPTTSDGTPFSISKGAVDKFVSESAVHKNEDYDSDAHMRVIPFIKDIIHNSIDAEIHPNYKKVNGERRPENGYISDSVVHRLYGAVNIDDKLYRVKTTMLEFKSGKQVNRPHTFEVAKIELVDDTANSIARQTSSNVSRIDGANLLKDVEKSYDKGKKLLDENGKSSENDSSQLDRDYLDAVENGDMETAEKMVSHAAKMLMPKTKVVDEDGKPLVVYHYGADGINIFDIGRARTSSDVQGMYFSDSMDDWRDMGYSRYDVYLNMRNPFVVDSPEKAEMVKVDLSKTGDGIRVREELQAKGYDGIINDKNYYGGDGNEYVVFSPNQIKSADAVTYDDTGNVIPLSKRFNSEKNDLRFRVVDEDGREKALHRIKLSTITLL